MVSLVVKDRYLGFVSSVKKRKNERIVVSYAMLKMCVSGAEEKDYVK